MTLALDRALAKSYNALAAELVRRRLTHDRTAMDRVQKDNT